MPLLNNQPKPKIPARRIGLSNRQTPPSLLSNFKLSAKLKVPQAFDDPPVSSEDEEEDTGLAGPPKNAKPPSKTPSKGSQISKRANGKTKTPLIDSSESSGDERAARASIKSTTFSRTTRSETSQETRSKRKESPVERADDLKDLDTKRRKTGEAGPRNRRKKSGSTPPPSSGEHLRDKLGFTKTRKSKLTYKKRDNSSQEPVVKKEKQKEPAKLRIPDVLESPEKPKAQKLRLPPSSSPSSPASKPALRQSKSFESSQGSNDSRRKKKLHKLKAKERSPSPPRAVFKVPSSISGLQLRTPKNDTIEEPLTDDPSDVEKPDKDAAKPDQSDDDQVVEPVTVCPWCGEPVDKELLDDFAKGRRLNVRLQTKFCRKHKKQTAVDMWKQKSYPEIDWHGLDTRFARHHESLLDIINGGASYFRSMHEMNIASGKVRSMKKEDNMNPGYYGPRGFNLMCDHLVDEFSDLLKKKAVDDRVIAGRGPAAFIQTVLVAELAVQLIMEDMDVAEDKARMILEESKALGEMIHEET